MTYADLDALSDRMAGHLVATGTQPGDRVGLMLPNVPQLAIAYYGALKAGAVVVPMNVLVKAREVPYYLGDSGARTLIAWGGFLEEAHAGVVMPASSHSWSPRRPARMSETSSSSARCWARRRRWAMPSSKPPPTSPSCSTRPGPRARPRGPS
jgi:acyl-CoA synthetase (AMP-forming)/AMP-acid ligase II